MHRLRWFLIMSASVTRNINMNGLLCCAEVLAVLLFIPWTLCEGPTKDQDNPTASTASNGASENKSVCQLSRRLKATGGDSEYCIGMDKTSKAESQPEAKENSFLLTENGQTTQESDVGATQEDGGKADEVKQQGDEKEVGDSQKSEGGATAAAPEESSPPSKPAEETTSSEPAKDPPPPSSSENTEEPKKDQ
ncbi:hypothetical protein CCH79_00002089 [Gambusia affinis]|uniref:Uncharacterized protein n=1 Tax=Gambusia affinis TaxID=33528 RepID=A0A315VTQ9_GAMAF|nr:hypothetical protein CCH79_00002089 [Gambusia affinis]